MATIPTTDRLQISEEHRKLLKAWNDTSSDYPRHLCVHQVFEEQAARRPDAIAVRFLDQVLTYRQLNERANQLAHRLRELGVRPDVMVGTLVERSLEMPIALLGILKAGGAFVPLDVNYPADRLAFMASDTRSPVLLTQQKVVDGLDDRSWLPREVITLDWHSSPLCRQSRENPGNTTNPENLAYVMYTSGSTGRPKGVMVQHRAVVRLVKRTNYLDFGDDEVFLQLSPISFDASTLEIWGALLNGGCLAVASPGTVSLDEIGATIRKHGVTTAWLTAGLFNLMVEQRLDDLKPLRQLLAGGDTLSVVHVKKALAALPHCRLVNGYGPTEGTTFTCCHPISAQDTQGTSIPIGRPIANTRVYLLDKDGDLAPVGEEAELYAAGDGVAQGYLNQSELTAERFVKDPFSDDPNAKLYKTGDLARYRSDGSIEFRGRIDNQVKISGYRIEPGEIEAALAEHRDVKDAVVIARQEGTGEKKLVGYVVPTNGSLSIGDLKAALQHRLPAYMVPSSLVVLDALPLSPNGKVDRGALPAPEITREIEADKPPTLASELETKIAAVWSKVLSLNQVSPDDNFFDLGGDSLQLLEVHAELGKALTSQLSVTDLFEYTTVRSLAARLSGSEGRNLHAAQERARQQQAVWAQQKR